jgi:ATP-binding protein involved in chromosome partitioning
MSYHVCSHCGEREDIFGHGGARAASTQAEIPFLGEIPLHTAIRVNSDAGQPVALGDGESPGARAFREVAESLAARVSVVNAGAGEAEPVLVVR